MATSFSNFPKTINRYKLLTLSLLLLPLFCFFLFNRSALIPKLTDLSLTSQTPAPLLVSRSPQFHDKLDDLRQPASSSLSNPEQNADGNVSASSILSQPESQEDRNVETTVPISSNLDDETTQKPLEQPVSSEPKLEDDSGQRTGVGKSSNAKETVPISSNSDLGDDTPQKTSEPSVSSEPDTEDDSGEITGEAESSNEEKIVPISSNSDLDGSGERNDEPELKEGKIIPIASKPDIDEKSSGKLEENSVKIESASLDSATGGVIDNAILEKLQNCDIYKGTWVKDEGYPIYRPGSCPYVDEAFDCQSNGRPDSAYTQWRWKPDECELPRFNVTDFLVRLRGKRLMLVGDSMNRNQFESLLCLLREALPDKSKMYETRGNKISKGRGYFIFKFVDYDCTVEFVRSHFLVREGVRVNAQGNSNPTLSIDRIDKTANRWLRADILVFNTGHWWTHGKTSRGKNYYKEGDYIHPRFDPVEAYRRAIKTWATWIKENIKRDKLVIYRGYSSAHFRHHISYPSLHFDHYFQFLENTIAPTFPPLLDKQKIIYELNALSLCHLDQILVFTSDPICVYCMNIQTLPIKSVQKMKILHTFHFLHRGGDWDSGGSCNGETEPIIQGAIIDSYPQKMTIVEETIKETQVPVVLLNVTRLTNYRKDGHPSVYGKNVTRLKKVSTRRQDCSHWCLPGVPDAWNELIYATLVARQT